MRYLDLLLCCLLLVVLLPFLLPVVFILKFSGEGYIFYWQERVGKNLDTFLICKFATMMKDSPILGAGTITEKDDPRVLPFGRILRKTKINEVPQLYNILIGQMSFVGPRPCVRRDLVGVSEHDLAKVWSVPPGITGIASVIFRNEEDILHQKLDGRLFYDEVITPYKTKLNLWYSDNKNLSNDLKIMVLTVTVVLSGDTSLVYRWFGNLPRPPEELLPYLKG
jgi:lipopolysaccharide/colanic/teichoic acid biosynthesis glycosyltransferase